MTRHPEAVAGIDWLNALTGEEAQAELLRCCGSTRWARRVAEKRPYSSFAELLEAADRIWWGLEEEDWLEAFSRHPRIGEQRVVAGESTGMASWSAAEQAGAQQAAAEVRAALREGNRQYEERFGRIYLVCATGKSGEEMLSLLRQRLRNDPATELRVAAEEQRQITHLRLKKLLEP